MHHVTVYLAVRRVTFFNELSNQIDDRDEEVARSYSPFSDADKAKVEAEFPNDPILYTETSESD